ncbi:D-alanine--D-alanine ligase [Polystyrenella longa]|uniref:D-alanine--D-alanine ligase n=1 Tax=Polystyrenella longa TaxID=2528007 RepID=A0A518CPW0_9PLAN|nr:RimK family protein [Polystyrenella longa]QDU81252.1 D-alanine--D-alanine ligase [Polystyrenella longa]
MDSIKYIIVTEKPKLIAENSDRLVLSQTDFVRKVDYSPSKKGMPKVINLSGNYDYLSKGYYISLLAEARGMPCIPNVSNIVALNWRRNYQFALPELSGILEKTFDEPVEEPLSRTYTTFFGRHENPKIEPVARRMFDLFRFPLMSFEVKCSPQGKWAIEKIETPSFQNMAERQSDRFTDALSKFTGSAWRYEIDKKKQEKYWLAILHDPKEEHAPSNKAALKKFISVGKKMGIWVELITRHDFSTLLEFDALFLRETTAINNHTYRFANKAEQEDIPCIDDTKSIIRCCNKVYLKELLASHHIATPKSLILDKKNLHLSESEIPFPCVLKIPDGSFSRGVIKVSDKEELRTQATRMLQKSDFILCQEFVASDFDWRIGVLNNEPLFGIKYYMAQGHWQIYNHAAKQKSHQEGDDEIIPIEHVPTEVLDAALKAAKLIGNGLYGVDLKQTTDGRVLVIEVNDNPNIDAGVEDKILGDVLYQKILNRFIELIEE